MTNDDDDKSEFAEIGMVALEGIEPYRELLRGVVAAFMADGFTDEQARALTVQLVTHQEPS